MGKIKKINICAMVIALFLALCGGVLLSHSNEAAAACECEHSQIVSVQDEGVKIEAHNESKRIWFYGLHPHDMSFSNALSSYKEGSGTWYNYAAGVEISYDEPSCEYDNSRRAFGDINGSEDVILNVYVNPTYYQLYNNKLYMQYNGSYSSTSITFDECCDAEGTGYTQVTHYYARISADSQSAIPDGAHYGVRLEPNQLSLTLSHNNGTGKTEKIYYYYLCALPSSVSVPTYTGYKFNGYYDSNGNQVYDSSGYIVSKFGIEDYDYYGTLWGWDDANLTSRLTASWTQNSYTVSFAVNNSNYGKVDKTSISSVASGTSVTKSSNTITIGSTKVTATTIDKTGYTTTFSSWSNAPTSITGAVTITANFSRVANTYYVQYNGNGATSGSTAKSTHTYEVSKALTANGFAKQGYKFKGWNTKKNGTGTPYSDKATVLNLTSSPNATLTLYAQWEAKTVNYNVSHFVMDTNGNYPTTADKTQTLSGKVDTKLTLANLKDSSLTSTGIIYSYGEAYGTKVDTATIPTSGTLSINLYYARNAYKVTLTPGIGIQSVFGADTYYYQAPVTINATLKNGCTWTNWTNLSNNAVVTTSQEYSFTMPAGAITYKANANDSIYPTIEITRISHKTFSWQASDNAGIAGWKISTNSNTPTTWESAATSGSHDVTAGGTYFVHVKDDAGNVASESITAFTLSVVQARGTSLAVSASGIALSNGVAVLEGTEIFAEASVLEGYTSLSLKDGDAVVANPYTTTVSQDKTISTTVEKIPYSITYILNGGIVAEGNPATYTIEDTFTLNNPSREGYTFLGWTGANGEAPALEVAIAQGNTGDKEFTANWQVNTYAVAYDKNGGHGEMQNSAHTYDQEQTLPQNAFTKTGYTFAGWNTQSDGQGVFFNDQETVLNLTATAGEIVTLYAIWQPNIVEYTINHFVMNTSGEYLATPTKTETRENAVDTTLILADLQDASLVGEGITYSHGKAYDVEYYEVTIPTEGALEINLFYERGAFEVALTAGAGIVSVSGADTYFFGASVTINAEVQNGYKWLGWTGTETITAQEYTFEMPAHNVALQANAGDATKPSITIFKVDYNTFEWSASDTVGVVAGFAITTSASAPSDWTAGDSGSHDVTAGGTYFVHVKDDAGNVASESITAFTLSFVQARGTSLAVSASGIALSNGVAVLEGTEIFAEASLLEGYTSLALKDGDAVVENPYTTTVSQNKTISTTAEKIPYSITYTLNGGVVGEGNPATYTIEDTFTLNNPSREGYTFLGWTGSNLTTPALEVAIAQGTTGDQDFTANWQVNTYAVAYDKNGGHGEMQNSAHTYDQEQTLPQNAFTKTGYTFAGWNTQSDGQGVFFNDQETVLNLTATAGEIVTLYAIWQPNIVEYTINHFVMNASGEYLATPTKTETRENAVDTTLTLADLQDASLVNEGITYNYGKAYDVEYYEVTISPEGALEINLFYERGLYEVTLTAGAGIASVSGANTYFFGASVTINAEVQNGYKWLGWTGTETIAAQKHTFEMPAHNVALQANAGDATKPSITISKVDFNTFEWSATDTVGVVAGFAITTSASAPSDWTVGDSCSHDVTAGGTYFVHVKDDAGNVASESITAFTLSIVQARGTSLAVSASGIALSNGVAVLEGTEISAEASVLEGYTSLSLKDGDAVVANPYTTTVSQDKTISTTAEKIPYSITYILNGGIVAEGNPDTYTIEDTFTLNNPTKEGYTFLGWTGSNGAAPALEVAIAQGTTGDKDFTANWEVNTYAVAYDKNGGHGEMQNSAHTYDQEQTLPQNAFTKTGYTFTGWNTQSDGQGAFFNDQEIVLNLTANAGEIVTLYAIWQPNIVEYTINHFVMITSGEYLATPTKTETRENAVDNTLTLADLQDASLVGEGITYNHGKAYDVEYYEVTIPTEGALEINLFYERGAFEVTLTAGAGIASVSGADTYFFGENVTINAILQEGYAWTNWTGTETIAAQEYTFEMPAHNVALQAKAGDATKPSITISKVDFNTFTWSATDTVGVVAGFAITTSASAPSDWAAGDSGSHDVTAGGTYFVHVKDDAGNVASESITAFTLSVVQARGTSLAVSASGITLSNGVAVLEGTEISAEASVLEGYTSLSLKDGDAVVANPYTTTISQNKTISTTAEKIPYSITYILNGGIVAEGNPATYTIEDTFTLNNPSREGYTFLGWTGSNGAAPALEVAIAQGTTGDKDFTANWEAIPAVQPVITSQPVGGKTKYGEAMTLAVIADIPNDYGLTYQWFKNNAPIDGATDRLYTTDESILAGDVSEYNVQVTATRNDNGLTSFVMSDTAIVEVEFLDFENVEVQGAYVGEFTGDTKKIVATTTTPYALVEYSIDNTTWQTETIDFVDVTNGAQTIYWQITMANYNTQTGSEIIDITQAQNRWTVQPTILDWTYGDNKNSPVGATTFGEVKFEYAPFGTENFLVTIPNDAGKYILRASVEESANFEGLLAEVAFEIHKREVAILWGQTNFFFDNTPKLPTATAGNLVGDDVCNVIVDGAQTLVSETPYIATIVGLSNPNYKLPAMGLSVEFFITYQQITDIVVEGFAGAYDAAPHGISISGFEATDVISYSLDEATWQAQPITRTDAGITNVFVKVEREFFAPFVAYAEISISQVVLAKPTADTNVYTYTGEAQTYLPLGFDNATMTISNNQQTFANEGGYVVVVEIADKVNYVWEDATQGALEFVFIIEKQMPSVLTMPTFSSVYAGQTLADVQIIGGEMSVAGAFSWEAPTQKLQSGQNSAMLLFTPNDEENYNIFSQSVDVSAAQITITFAVSNFELGDVSSGEIVCDYGTQISVLDNQIIAGNSTITATPKTIDGAVVEFVSWTNATDAIITQPLTIIANFEITKISVSVSEKNYFSTNTDEILGGSAALENQSEKIVQYSVGEKIVAFATPTNGYELYAWIVNGHQQVSTSLNTLELTAETEPLSIVAVFIGKKVEVALEGDNATPNDIIGGNKNGKYYHVGDVIEIDATANAGFVFDNEWMHSAKGKIQGPTYTLNAQDAQSGKITLTALTFNELISVNFVINGGGSATLQNYESNDQQNAYKINYTADIVAQFAASERYVFAAGTFKVDRADAISLETYIQDQTIQISCQMFAKASQITITLNFEEVLWQEYVFDNMIQANGATQEVLHQFDFVGLGTKDAPYQINTPEQFALLSYIINNNIAQTNQNKQPYNGNQTYYVVNGQLDLKSRFWTPIGTTENPFNATIKFEQPTGIYLSTVTTAQIGTLYEQKVMDRHEGLFGCISNHAKINPNPLMSTVLPIGAGVLAGIIALWIIIALIRRKNRAKSLGEHTITPVALEETPTPAPQRQGIRPERPQRQSQVEKPVETENVDAKPQPQTAVPPRPQRSSGAMQTENLTPERKGQTNVPPRPTRASVEPQQEQTKVPPRPTRK